MISSVQCNQMYLLSGVILEIELKQIFGSAKKFIQVGDKVYYSIYNRWGDVIYLLVLLIWIHELVTQFKVHHNYFIKFKLTILFTLLVVNPVKIITQ